MPWRRCTAICMGEQGVLSRVTNAFLTPVTHPLLPTAAAPGQVRDGAHSRGDLEGDYRPLASARHGARSLHSVRSKSCTASGGCWACCRRPSSACLARRSSSPCRRCCTTPVRAATSKARVHQRPLTVGTTCVGTRSVAGFERLELPYRYTLCEMDDVDVAVAKMAEVWGAPPAMGEPARCLTRHAVPRMPHGRQPTFGGASVTIPLKEAIAKRLPKLTAAARAIGTGRLPACGCAFVRPTLLGMVSTRRSRRRRGQHSAQAGWRALRRQHGLAGHLRDGTPPCATKRAWPHNSSNAVFGAVCARRHDSSCGRS